MKYIVIIGLQLVLSLVVSGCAQTTYLVVGDNIKIKGMVTENEKSCIVDGRCSLKIDSGDREILVIYNTGYTPYPCINYEITNMALQINQGDKIEAYGKVIEENTISTCDIKDYYIKTI